MQGRQLVEAFSGEIGAGQVVPVELEAQDLAPGMYIVQVHGETPTRAG